MSQRADSMFSMSIFSACQIDFTQSPVRITVTIEPLVAAVQNSETCPFVLTVDESLTFLSLSVDKLGDARPPYVALFRAKEGLTLADARVMALSVLNHTVAVRVEDDTGSVEWQVEPLTGAGDTWWRRELLDDVFR